MLALIDGDEIAFKASAQAQSGVDWYGDGTKTLAVRWGQAREMAVAMVDRFRAWAKCKQILVCFSPTDRSNFRKLLLPSYKNNRTADKPAAYWECVEAIKAHYIWREQKGLEADDLLGILGTATDTTVVCSSDKDMATLPCRWLRPLKQQAPRPTRSRRAAADWRWMHQTLTGDPTDGYKGCPRVGKIGADKILAGFTTVAQMWPAVADAYAERDLDENYAITQARMARILRAEDADLTNGIINLWHPTGVPVPLNLDDC